jgi:predicted metal-dependent phosphoesterase TrpH
LLQLASEANLQGISITDHDTIAAYANALPIACKLNLKLLPGIELTAYHESHTIHILGYGFDLTNTKLLQTCEALFEARLNSNRLILEKLKRYRFDISEEELKQQFPNRVIGRPHIAKIMVQKGYVQNIKAAFTDYLGDKSRCARGPIRILSVSEAINLIHQAGGMAVLAHPHLFKNKKFVHKLLTQSSSFDGIETFYGLMPPEIEKPIADLATQHNLFMTGGSDFHGEAKPHIRLGCSFTPEDTFEKLYQLSRLNNH